MKNSIKSLKRLYSYIKPFKWFFITALIMTLLGVIANALGPVVIGLAITELGKNVSDMLKGVKDSGINYNYVFVIGGFFLLTGFVTLITQYLSIRFMTNAVQGAMKRLRRDVSEKINKLPVSYFDSRKQGDILSVVTNDIDAISNALQQSVIQIVTAIFGIIFAVIMMIYISFTMAIITIIIIPASILISKFIIKKSQRYFVNQQNTLGELNGYIQEKYNGFDTVKLYNKEEDSIKDFKKINDKLTDNAFKATFVSGLMMPLAGGTAYAAYIAMSVLGGHYAIAGVITIGSLQAFIQYIWQVNQPISQMTQLSSILQTASAATTRIFELLDETEEVEESAQHTREDIKGSVVFEDVSFGYSSDKPLIENLNFKVNEGETVAIVGPTGAGKTTLINLLMRFYDVNSGAIKIDEIDTKKIPRSEVRELFGMVLQDSWLYSGSVKDNIAFGKSSANEEEVINAAKTANIHGFIKSLPNGYDTVLNESTSNISQGQKQLLTIARAVVSNPKILILDEATSSVDTRLEVLIQKAMKKVMEGRTSFVIAHRLSTIRDADLILVMNNGNIVEHGKHEELLEKQGFYEKLYNSQFADS